MFWRKKKTKANVTQASDLLDLAARLGVERRQNVRVRYPERTQVCKLPRVSVEGRDISVMDISVGGCCLIDPFEVLGPSIGHTIQLDLQWTTGVERVLARMVARVDDRRHIQFLNFPESRQALLRRFMTPGVHGTALRLHEAAPNSGSLRLTAAEIWSSLQGDSVILDTDFHRLGTIQYMTETFTVYKGAWPVKQSTLRPCNKIELEQLVLFLANIPRPSERLAQVLQGLEDLLIDATFGTGPGQGGAPGMGGAA